MGIFYKSDRSFIEPEKVKSTDEGNGQLLASIGKEIDEHDLGRVVATGNRFITIAIGVFISCIGLFFLLLAIAHLAGAIFLGSANSKGIIYDSDNLRKIITDDVIEYQVKSNNGWYMVDEDTYKLKKFRETQK